MYDTIIIGAGIAGMTASIYASRKRMKYELISKNIGGQFMESGEVLNYPGIVHTTGVEFNSKMQEQLKNNNVNIVSEKVMNIEKVDNKFRIITDKNSYDTKTVIIATGARPKRLQVPGENEFLKRGVTYCSICDGPLYAGKEVVIVGGGDSALEAVDFLKDIVAKIYVFVREDKFSGHEYLIERVKNNPKTEIIFNSNIKEIIGEKFVQKIKYEQNNEIKELDAQGIIIEIGRIPNTESFKDIVKLDSHTHIEIDCQQNTSVPGIFAAGDCASGHEYQYVISAGQGCMALIKAAKYLASQKQ
jgi:thioredoxin-disulfide reductase